MKSSFPPPPVPALRESAPSGPVVHRVDSRALLLGRREVVIQHGEQQYRLRHTQNDKLILTK
jgi:hemin uptake protein HemP